MVDQVNMVFVKPQIDEKALKGERNRQHLLNTAATAGTLGVIGAGAVGADALVKNDKVKKFVTPKVTAVVDFVKRQAAKVPGSNHLKNAAVSTKNFVGAQVGKVAGFVGKINPKVKIAAGVAAGVVAAKHFVDAGRIDGHFKGFKSANETLDTAVNTVQKVVEDLFGGPKTGEQQPINKA